jgi:hypothetical protein
VTVHVGGVRRNVRRHAEHRHEAAVSESALAAFDWPLRGRDGSGVCVFITAVPITKLFAWGEGDSGGHVL